MLPNNTQMKSSLYGQSPFKKLENFSNCAQKVNYMNDPKQLYYPNLYQEKINNPQIRFGVNFYFPLQKPNFYQPIIYSQNFQPQEIFYPPYIPENGSANILFNNPMAKSGYGFIPEQSMKFQNNYNRPNNINNNNYYDNYSYYPINNNNNIINNIYPTFTKVTHVQIISDNENKNIPENKSENKKEIIKDDKNNNNVIDLDEEVEITHLKKEENEISNNVNKTSTNNNKKKLFECSETNCIDISAKNVLKKKRIRKSDKQLGLLSKFFKENKNWSKNQIKEISENTGLKENKIYKWLWDQKNKQYKATKFVVNK